MARHASALKAARQAVRHAVRNQAVHSKYKTAVKKLRAAIAGKGKKEELQKTLVPLLNEVQRVLTKAASKRIIRRETASRQISRLSIAVHKRISPSA